MNQSVAIAGDTPKENIKNPFNIHLSKAFRIWIAREGISLAFTTYSGAKLIVIGPGLSGGTSVSERDFERCMALYVENERHIWISTHHHVWKLENGLQKNQQLNGWDRIYLPRTAHVTGGVDVHDLVKDKTGTLYGVITTYNCIASIGGDYGSFSPYWRPPFISAIAGQDRCHLNGFCLNEAGELGYATAVSTSDQVGGWREHKRKGGIIIDIQTNRIIARGLSMPHTPRLFKGKLWFLEAGKGNICTLDLKTKTVKRVLWRPGFLRGLRFYKDYALICSSEPRDKVFEGLPLQETLDKKKISAQCALEIIDTNTMEVVHSITITGTVKEIYDVAILENCRQPLLHGIQGDEIRKIVVLGEDTSEPKKKIT